MIQNWIWNIKFPEKPRNKQLDVNEQVTKEFSRNCKMRDPFLSPFLWGKPVFKKKKIEANVNKALWAVSPMLDDYF